MIRALREWADDRLGLSATIHEALYERIPSGARWRYITGSMLVFAFVTQAVTGIFLWMAYSPSSQTAYESVWYIQHQMAGGWLVRGVHHFMAQAMVVVMALHMLQVVWDGAYRKPREVNYWLGLVLMQLVLGLGLTGYLLPWDQKGYWATNVATNLATLVPVVGKDVQQLAVGGNEYGHHTLTRFFAMHAGVLPALLVIFLALHIALFRKHGITAKETPGRPDDYFWPRQVLLDAVGCLVLLGIVLLCVVHFDVSGVASGNLPEAHKGAELGAPADPSEAYSAARPEWYYLFLFQLLKYFPGSSEVIGAIVLPGVAMTILFLIPFIGRWELGHQFNRAFVLLLLLGSVVLTGLALSEDYFVYVAKSLKLDETKYEKQLAASRDFLVAREAAEHDAHRINELINRREWLAEEGELSEPRLISKQGAVHLLRNDPKTRGSRLFKQHCASCHDYVDPEGNRPPGFSPLLQSPELAGETKVKRDDKGEVVYPPAASGAPNLYGFGSRAWIRGILNPELVSKIEYGEPQPSADPEHAAEADHPENHLRAVLSPYYGNTNHQAGRMATWVKQHASLLADDQTKSDEDVDAIVAALSAQAQLRSQAQQDSTDGTLIARGVDLIQQHCTSCHRFGDHGQLGLAPDLTGYGSYEWMMGLVSDPAHERFYGKGNDRMPSFAKDLAHPERNNVSVRELSLIVDWLRGDYYEPTDEQPVLPHTPEVAQETVILSRTVSEPRGSLVGAPPAEPETQLAKAERLFEQNCASCHSHADTAGNGIVAKNPSAPNLHGFGSRTWALGILDAEKVAGPDFLGNTRHKGGQMAQEFVATDLADTDDETKAKIALIATALSAEAALPAQRELDKEAESDGSLEKGREALSESFETYSCTDCHKFRDAGDLGSAPDLTGWGSQEWLVEFITNPMHERFYRDENDRMPAFGVAGPGPKEALLSPDEIQLLAKWIRGEPLE
ncbi:MAG: cytochrome b N-terminal domain-containing protein [Pirellulaceae bacterium]|jgi:ubiquinol-cytochrome c reductase cytochrome b subunit|nr:cytochrome b N-terminal domain-containing protein [Pirellulaceae bacterium]